MSRLFYVYEHIRLDAGTVFYVGKGHNRRAWAKDMRNARWWRIVNLHGYDVRIAASDLTEEAAFSLEKELIAFYGRKQLCNATDGGEGASGAIRSPEVRAKLSEANKGKRSPRKGVTLSEETKAKISAANKGRIMSREFGEKMSALNSGQGNGFYGKQHTDETKRKLSEMRKGTRHSEESISKLKAQRAKRVGKLSPSFDSRLHVFSHEEHGDVEMTQYEFRNMFGLSQPQTSALVRGKRKTLQGWSLTRKGIKE